MEGIKDLFTVRARIALAEYATLLIVEDYPTIFTFADAPFVCVCTAFAVFFDNTLGHQRLNLFGNYFFHRCYRFSCKLWWPAGFLLGGLKVAAARTSLVSQRQCIDERDDSAPQTIVQQPTLYYPYIFLEIY